MAFTSAEAASLRDNYSSKCKQNRCSWGKCSARAVSAHAQVGFVTFVVRPLYAGLTKLVPDLNFLLSRVDSSIAHWSRLKSLLTIGAPPHLPPATCLRCACSHAAMCSHAAVACGLRLQGTGQIAQLRASTPSQGLTRCACHGPGTMRAWI